MVMAKKGLLLSILYALIALSKISQGVAINPGAAWSWYKTQLKTYPLCTKSTTSSVIMTVSDILCQEIMREKAPAGKGKKGNAKKGSKAVATTSGGLDYTRVLHVAITGFIWSGPISHHWYATLEKIVKIQDPIGGLIARIVLDALIFSPVAVSGYFSVRSILEGSGVEGIRHKLTTKFAPTVVGAWKFWPAANVVNFGAVPIQYRVLYNNVLSLFWTGYLTHVNAKAKQSAADAASGKKKSKK